MTAPTLTEEQLADLEASGLTAATIAAATAARAAFIAVSLSFHMKPETSGLTRPWMMSG